MEIRKRTPGESRAFLFLGKVTSDQRSAIKNHEELDWAEDVRRRSFVVNGAPPADSLLTIYCFVWTGRTHMQNGGKERKSCGKPTHFKGWITG